MHRFNIDLPFRILGIYTAFESHWDSEQIFKGESHDFWEIVTVISGQMEVVEDDRYYILEGGMSICHAPGEFHRIRSAGGTSPHFSVLTFSHEGHLPQKLKDGVFTLSKEMTKEYLGILPSLKGFYERSIAAVREGKEPPEAGNAEYEALLRLERYILSLSGMDVSEGARSMSLSAREYRSLVRIMTEQVCSSLSLSRLAEMRHISVSYVKKLFHAYAGESPMSYYARLRVGEIKRRLTLGESLTSIAETMNFSSCAYLSTFFKKQTGITTGEFIRGKQYYF